MEKITSAKNPTVQQLRDLKNTKNRRRSGMFLVEGEVMIREALKCGLNMRILAADEEHADAWRDAAAQAISVPRGILESICETQTPQGVCAAFDLPQETPADRLPNRIVALDGVQDPGNVGTIWRTADAAGFQGVLLGAGCADPLSAKVMRAAMGSGFRLPFAHTQSLADTLARLRSAGYRVLASDLHGDDFYNCVDGGEKFVLVIGNEARGISDAVRENADVRVKLPMRGGAESLNAAVAAGIMMYEIMRRHDS